jgi:predicted transposase YbfD/YdcC
LRIGAAPENLDIPELLKLVDIAATIITIDAVGR